MNIHSEKGKPSILEAMASNGLNTQYVADVVGASQEFLRDSIRESRQYFEQVIRDSRRFQNSVAADADEGLRAQWEAKVGIPWRKRVERWQTEAAARRTTRTGKSSILDAIDRLPK